MMRRVSIHVCAPRALASIVFGVVCYAANPTSAATLFVQLFSKTGEVRLQNRDTSAAIPFVFYSIKSPSGALLNAPSVWRSIARNYDAPLGVTPGNGFVDPNGPWIEISDTTTELAEGALDLDGGMIAPQRSVSLGRIWNLAAFPNITVMATAPDGLSIDVSVVLAIDGDYLPDGTVTSFDYQLWRQYFGSTSVLLADGNLDGTVNAADYVLWRDNLGMSVPSLAAAASSDAASTAFAAGFAVPEPAGACGPLWAAGIVAFFVRARDRRCRSLRRNSNDSPLNWAAERV